MEKKMVVGVIGLTMGRHHLKGLIDNNIEVAAICDINPEFLKREGDLYNIPVATNIATAEVLVRALDRGDLDWREIVNPRSTYNLSKKNNLLGRR